MNGTQRSQDYILSIAPMMDYTDRYYRMLMRLITKRTWLYTEMISTSAITHGDERQLLEFDEREKPLVLQIGGSNLDEMKEAAKRAIDYGYDEININAGCPSKRVKEGSFGVCLMADAERTAEILHAVANTVPVPVSIKCRIGLDGRKYGMPLYDTYEHLHRFVEHVKNAGAIRVSIHARIAILGKFNTKENRNIPPLRYEDVYQIARSFSGYPIEINGGIRNYKDMYQHLRHVDAVMMGRAAIEDPLMFCNADAILDAILDTVSGVNAASESGANLGLDAATNSGTASPQQLKEESEVSRDHGFDIARLYAEYLTQCILESKEEKKRRHVMHALRHLFPFFSGRPGARTWRSSLTQSIVTAQMPRESVQRAIEKMQSVSDK